MATMQPTSSFHALLMFSLLLLSLSACQTTPTGPPLETQFAPQAMIKAEQMVAEGKTLGAVRLYEQLAVQAAAPLRQRYQLLATELLFNHGYPELGIEHLNKIDEKALSQNPNLLRKKLRLDVQAALAEQNGSRALGLLSRMQASNDQEQAEQLSLQASAYQYSGDWREALTALQQRETLLSGNEAVLANQQQIWQLLSAQSRNSINELRSHAPNPSAQGWAELNHTALTPRLSLEASYDAIRQWRTLYQDHPASSQFLQNLQQQLAVTAGHPKQIALLLPLTGRYRAAATAVRDGFLAAAYQQSANTPQPEIRIYDVSNGTTTRASYQHAIKEGAKFIIGPLSKTDINQFRQQEKLAVPTLSLNYADINVETETENLFQFGLLPEDEARQVARAAFNFGYRNAVALVPNTAWGTRLVNAFQAEFSRLGGQLLEHANYGNKESDFSAPIEQLMKLGASKQRKRNLQRTIGLQSIKFEPRRRQDVDMVFIAANPAQARLIKPQLKFHHSGDLPTFATSKLYRGAFNQQADKDMEGIIFCATPWLLPNNDKELKTYQMFHQLWPKSMRRYAQLYALGYDAFQIAPYLKQMHNPAAPLFPGKTGLLSLGDDNRLHRELRWAQFHRGTAKPISIPTPLTENKVLN
ncbi:MAG: penicillin-binding protein activator [Gammaproteobacteria bacterium]|nr:penicillin-binding protein activator [Gammaproteobacteria bacterium]